MTSRDHHYVWLHYLQAWGEDGLVHCSRNGKVLPLTNPKNLMVERDYNRLPRLKDSDLAFLRLSIESTGSAELRQLHREFVDDLAHIVQANEIIQSDDRCSADEKHLAQGVVIETLEKLHGQIERRAFPILEELRQKQTDFINNYDSAMAFFRFIGHQYLRTKRVREGVGEVHSQMFPGHDFARLANILCYIHAENLGASLFVDRNEFDIIFLECRGEIRFVTGDQPIVNLMADGYGRETTELAFYYPLCPDLSCLLSPKDYGLDSAKVPGGIVQDLNDFIAWQSKQFLVANSNTEIQRILRKPPLQKPPTSRILDSLAKRA